MQDKFKLINQRLQEILEAKLKTKQLQQAQQPVKPNKSDLVQQKAKEKELSKRQDKVTNDQKNRAIRSAAGDVWQDKSLLEWPQNDFRIYCANLGNEVSDDLLANCFRKYKSFVKAKVIKDKRTGKSRGFGFVSMMSSQDFLKALKQMNGKHIGNQPVKLSRSKWQDRTYENGKLQLLGEDFSHFRKKKGSDGKKTPFVYVPR